MTLVLHLQQCEEPVKYAKAYVETRRAHLEEGQYIIDYMFCFSVKPAFSNGTLKKGSLITLLKSLARFMLLPSF